jgi:hypothetical protein
MRQTFDERGLVWATRQFGSCELGDVRRKARLIDYAARQVAHPEASTHSVCEGEDAVVEGTYRWLRNAAVDPNAVMQGPYQATVDACGERELVLAIQDTTTLVFSHAVANELGEVGGVDGHRVAGILAHSTLLVDGLNREPIGLIDQQRWTRAGEETVTPKRQKETGAHKKRAYADKESAKWQHATEQMCQRLKSTKNVVTVCDREADIYDYLAYMVDHELRFVIRAGQDRNLLARTGPLFEVLAAQPVVGQREVRIAQRGAQRGTRGQTKRSNRRARTAIMSIRAMTIELLRPANRKEGPDSLRLAAVHLRERHPPRGETPAEWFLLTTEPMDSLKQVERIITCYEGRWIIEEFHKAWKSGCRIEARRLQSLGNLERLMAVTAPIAVRILQLRSIATDCPDASCTAVLSNPYWRCLFAKLNPDKLIPKKPPTLAWALGAIGKLGGWRDTKQTGAIGWQSLWTGWTRLDALVEGFLLAEKCA